jgi:hypothetical protein
MMYRVVFITLLVVNLINNKEWLCFLMKKRDIGILKGDAFKQG